MEYQLPARQEPAQDPPLGLRDRRAAATRRVDDDPTQREAADRDKDAEHEERQSHVGDHGQHAGDRRTEDEAGEIGRVEHAEALTEVTFGSQDDRPPSRRHDQPDARS